jgi:hypothetical protein
MADEASRPSSHEQKGPTAAGHDRLVQEAAAVLNQLRAYARQTLDERSFTALLADLTHMRIRLDQSRPVPEQVARALRALDVGIGQALEELHRREKPAPRT